MAEESKTPDLVELTRSRVDAFARGDDDLESLTPDAVYDASRFELGVHVGPTAIREFFGGWIGMLDGFSVGLEEVTGLGGGVVFLIYRQEGRPLGSSGVLRARGAQVINHERDGSVVLATFYPDIDEARAAAERLAEERAAD